MPPPRASFASVWLVAALVRSSVAFSAAIAFSSSAWFNKTAPHLTATPVHESSTAMDRITRSAFVACVLLAPIARAQQSPAARAMPAEQDRQLARAIYKEMIEIKSGYTTGAETAVAEGAAPRPRAAGLPGRDIFVGRAKPNRAKR